MIPKLLRAKLWWATLRSEAVDQEHIKTSGGLRDKLCTIFTKYLKPLVSLRNLERVPNRNDVRINLDNSEPGPGVLAVAPFGDRTATKANESDLARLREKHLECHHGSCVSERQKIWLAHDHLA